MRSYVESIETFSSKMYFPRMQYALPKLFGQPPSFPLVRDEDNKVYINIGLFPSPGPALFGERQFYSVHRVVSPVFYVYNLGRNRLENTRIAFSYKSHKMSAYEHPYVVSVYGKRLDGGKGFVIGEKPRYGKFHISLEGEGRTYVVEKPSTLPSFPDGELQFTSISAISRFKTVQFKILTSTVKLENKRGRSAILSLLKKRRPAPAPGMS